MNETAFEVHNVSLTEDKETMAGVSTLDKPVLELKPITNLDKMEVRLNSNQLKDQTLYLNRRRISPISLLKNRNMMTGVTLTEQI
jgi:hypothetical protein